MITVSRLSGTAWVRGDSGELRLLEVGDRVPADAEIITAEGASVELQAEGALPITIGAGREVALDPELFDVGAGSDSTESSVAPLDDPLAEQVLAALDSGEDPFDLLDPTAAVLAGSGDGAGDRKSVV